MHDLNDLLTGRYAGEHFLADGALFCAFDEIFGDLVVDIGPKEGKTNLAHGISDVFLRQLAVPAQVLQDTLQFVGKRIKHGGRAISAIDNPAQGN